MAGLTLVWGYKFGCAWLGLFGACWWSSGCHKRPPGCYVHTWCKQKKGQSYIGSGPMGVGRTWGWTVGVRFVALKTHDVKGFDQISTGPQLDFNSEFPNLVVSNLVVCNFYAEALFCVFFFLFFALLRSSALALLRTCVCALLRSLASDRI